MMFSSRGFKDPEPWAYALLGGDPSGWAREAEQVTGGFVYLPRTGINPQNWLLKAFRGEAEWIRDGFGDEYIQEMAQEWVDNIITYASEYGVESLDEVNHAYRVLSRLARLEENND